MENGNPQKKKLQTSSVISVFVFLADIYFIVNMKSNYAILGVAALATLFCILSTINAWTKWKEADSQRAEEHYVDIMKAEKSTHLVSQKSFQDLDEKLNFIGQKIMPLEKASSANQQKIATMLENLMDGQKKVAKVTISRSKENATALMNSNDQLIQRMEEFQQSILDMKSEVLEKQDEIYNKKLQKMDDNQKELVDKIQESANMFQNLQRMDASQKELAEKIQESAELFQNLQKMDDNQKELVEKIQESTDLIKNIIEVIPDKIAQMPQLAREPYPQFAANAPSGIGEEGLPQVAEDEVSGDGSMAEPMAGLAPEIPVDEAGGMGAPEYAAEPETVEYAEMPETAASEPEQMEASEYAGMPEQMESPEYAAEPAPEEMPETAASEPEQEPADLAAQLEGMLQPMEDLAGTPEEMANVSPENMAEAFAGETEEMPDVLPESDGMPEAMAEAGAIEIPEAMEGMGLEMQAGAAEGEPVTMPEAVEETGSIEVPEASAVESEYAAMPETMAEVPEAIADVGAIEIPEAIAGTEESMAMPEGIGPAEVKEGMEGLGSEEVPEAMADAVPESGEIEAPEFTKEQIEAANPELVSEATQIEPPISEIGPSLEELPELMADAAPISMELPQEASGAFQQAALTPDPIPEIGATNGIMTPEDIAALLANTADPEPEPEPDPIPAPFMGNGDGMMSPEEIAALIGNTAVEELPKMANRIEDSIKQPLPDISDPGKMLSPEDIASLIANM